MDSGDYCGLLSGTAQTLLDTYDRLLRMPDAFPPIASLGDGPSTRSPRHWAFEIKTVSKIEQRRATEYDRVATDAIADLGHSEVRRPRCVTRVEAALLIARAIDP
jgi:hypothetical protein